MLHEMIHQRNKIEWKISEIQFHINKTIYCITTKVEQGKPQDQRLGGKTPTSSSV